MRDKPRNIMKQVAQGEICSLLHKVAILVDVYWCVMAVAIKKKKYGGVVANEANMDVTGANQLHDHAMIK